MVVSYTLVCLACWFFCPELAFFKKRSLALKKSLLASGWMHLGNHSHSVYAYYIHTYIYIYTQ